MRSRLTSRLLAAFSGTIALQFALIAHAQGTPVQPGAEPPIGPVAAPPAAEAVPPAAEAAPPASEPAAAPAAQPAQPDAAAPGAPVGPNGEPLDVPFELQTLRDDQQGIQTDLENFKFQWQRERDLHTAITARPLTVSGVIQARFGWTDTDFSNAVTYKRRSTFDIGSAILAFNGTLYKDYEEGRNLLYSLRFGTSPQTAAQTAFLNLSLLDANIVYSLLPTVDRETPLLTITFGQQLLPFGIEVPATEELKPVIRNAEFTTALQLARRDIGAIVRGDLFTQVDYGYNYRQALIAYALGVINGSGPNMADDNDHKDLVGRLAFTLPSDYHSWLRQLTLGGTVYWGKRNTFLNDGKLTLSGKGKRQRLGADVYYNHWPLGVTYEFIVGKDAQTPGTTLEDPQTVVVTSRSHTATFFFSFGEQFVAGFRNQGRYDDWWPKTWQPFVRYDHFRRDLSKDNTSVKTLTLGLNVFFAETTKLQLNYNHRRDEVNPTTPGDKLISNEALAQLQFGF